MQGKDVQLITGQCHCGAVRYEALGPTVRQGTCRCRACQRATGALESPNVGVDPAAFRIVVGKPAEFRSESGIDCDSGVFHFCRDCGSQLYWQDKAKTEVAIFAGTLDYTSVFRAEE